MGNTLILKIFDIVDFSSLLLFLYSPTRLLIALTFAIVFDFFYVITFDVLTMNSAVSSDSIAV